MKSGGKDRNLLIVDAATGKGAVRDSIRKTVEWHITKMDGINVFNRIATGALMAQL